MNNQEQVVHAVHSKPLKVSERCRSGILTRLSFHFSYIVCLDY